MLKKKEKKKGSCNIVHEEFVSCILLRQSIVLWYSLLHVCVLWQLHDRHSEISQCFYWISQWSSSTFLFLIWISLSPKNYEIWYNDWCLYLKSLSMCIRRCNSETSIEKIDWSTMSFHSLLFGKQRLSVYEVKYIINCMFLV